MHWSWILDIRYVQKMHDLENNHTLGDFDCSDFVGTSTLLGRSAFRLVSFLVLAVVGLRSMDPGIYHRS